VLLILILGHATLLRAVGAFLIVSTAPARPDVILLMSGDSVFPAASELHARHPEAVLLKPEYDKPRLEQMGIWPDRIGQYHEEMTKRGVPVEKQLVLAGDARTEREVIEQLGRWLDQNSPRQVTVLCDEFQTRRMQTNLRSVLKERAAQVGIQPLPDRRFNASDWWKSRPGLRAVMFNYITLLVAGTHGGGDAERLPAWDPDEYERSLKDPDEAEAPRSTSPGLLASLARWLDIGERPVEVDHVVLLPGDENFRPFVAAAMVKAGLAKDILLPMNHSTPDVQDGLIAPVHDVTSRVLAARGVGDRLRILDAKSDSTVDDALAMKAVLDEEPEARVAVVSSFYHLRRARIAFRAVYGARADRFVYISTPARDVTPDNWWQSDHGIGMIGIELFKLSIYWVQYGPGKYWMIAVAAVLVLWRRRVVRRRRRQQQGSAPAGGVVPSPAGS